jgi:hypothetical protein
MSILSQSYGLWDNNGLGHPQDHIICQHWIASSVVGELQHLVNLSDSVGSTFSGKGKTPISEVNIKSCTVGRVEYNSRLKNGENVKLTMRHTFIQALLDKLIEENVPHHYLKDDGVVE